MELKKDLLKKDKKSVFRIILGILFFVISIVYITDRIMNNQIIRLFDWFYFGIFALNGILHTFEGFGFSIAKIFGKAFILIDKERISIKTGVFAKEQNVSWIDVKTIVYKFNRFQVIKSNDSSVTFDLSKLDYLLLKNIKEVFGSIANENGIEIRA